MLEPERHPEAVTKRRRQQAGARRRADQREGRQVERQRPRRRALADDDVEPVVLERRVEDLFNRAREPVDLVDEENVPLAKPGQNRRHIALSFQRRSRDRAQPHAELLADDVGEACLAQARRADQQQMVERLLAATRGLERDRELLLDALLADELAQVARTQRPLELVLLRPDRRRQELGLLCSRAAHAALFNASRTRSSGDASGSVPASAASASASE